MVTYQVFEEKLFNDELGDYTTFGISILKAECNEVIERIHDAFPNLATADRLVRLCNLQALDPSQLEDVIQDNL
jgi:hypothetical protein